MLGSSFVLQYFVSFLVLQSSRWRKESWLLNFCCVLNVMSLVSFFDSFFGLKTVVCVCGILLVKLTYYCMINVKS